MKNLNVNDNLLFEIKPLPKRATTGVRLPNGKFATKQQSEVAHLKQELTNAEKMRDYYWSMYMGLLMLDKLK